MSTRTVQSRFTAPWQRLPSVGASALLLLALLCAGCGDRGLAPAGPSLVAGPSTSAKSGGVARAVGGTLSGRFDFTEMWGQEWWEFYSKGTATGTLSHLGLSHMYTRHIPDVFTGALQQGTFQIVAANGDELTGTYEGSAVYDAVRQDLVHGTADFVITGGTGRFAGATGAIAVTFDETLDDPSWMSAKVVWTLNGTVSY